MVLGFFILNRALELTLELILEPASGLGRLIQELGLVISLFYFSNNY